MSTTFAIEGNPTGHFVLAPACHDQIGGTTVFDGAEHVGGDGARAYATYESAVADLVIHKATCPDCAHYGCYTQAIFDAPDTAVRIAHGNDALVLAVIGCPVADDGCVGTAEATEMIERLDFALATLGTEVGHSDDGIAPRTTRDPGMATFVDCGIEPGYLAATLHGIRDLAVEAAVLGRCVTWC